MTYKEWLNEYHARKSTLIAKLKDKGLDVEGIAQYFMYTNMKEAEPDYCPLYSTNEKCHNYEKLNCFFCACPHFRFSDTSPLFEDEGYEHYSTCFIKSSKGAPFKFEANNVFKAQLDCSKCYLPHTLGFVRKNLILD